MKVFVQKKPDGKEWLDINCYSAAGWFDQLGWEVVPFVDASKIEGLNKETPVVGGIGSVRKALEMLEAAPPETIDIPECIHSYTRRKIWTTTLGEVHNNETLWPVFIKPYLEHKRFTGHVVASFVDLLKTVCFPMDMPVLASEVVKWESEYRCFVLNREILDIRRYAGSFEWYPNVWIIKEMLGSYPSIPTACSLDVGKMVDGKNKVWDTALIEVNDGFSLGIYGLPAYKQVKMILARWKEMTK